MDYKKILQYEFDESKKILHFTYSEMVHIITEQQWRELTDYTESLISKYAENSRIYLIVDVKNLLVEPELVKTYSEYVKRVCDKYLMPNGVARYGTQLTRVTIKLGHDKILKKDPAMCKTKEDAYAYIKKQIENNSKVQASV